MSATELYVYYRLAEADEPAARAQVEALMCRLCQVMPGLRARLLRRGGVSAQGNADEPATWMEIYRHADGLNARQLEQIRDAAASLPGRRIGHRHEETFEPLAEWAEPDTGAPDRPRPTEAR